jgi:hypothetical protein
MKTKQKHGGHYVKAKRADKKPFSRLFIWLSIKIWIHIKGMFSCPFLEGFFVLLPIIQK